MIYTVSITSQGQISIPAKIRRHFRLSKTSKATLRLEENTIIVEPMKDLLELKGSLKTNKKPDPKAIREAFENYLAEEGAK